MQRSVMTIIRGQHYCWEWVSNTLEINWANWASSKAGSGRRSRSHAMQMQVESVKGKGKGGGQDVHGLL